MPFYYYMMYCFENSLDYVHICSNAFREMLKYFYLKFELQFLRLLVIFEKPKISKIDSRKRSFGFKKSLKKEESSSTIFWS